MAYYKNGWFDRFSTAATTFMLALPSIALIYIVRFVGSYLGLPDTFPLLGAGDVRSYVLPALILGILGTPSTVVWFRRYIVDLQGSDFVRFARAKGLSEFEISKIISLSRLWCLLLTVFHKPLSEQLPVQP